jgi:hypothetical protein
MTTTPTEQIEQIKLLIREWASTEQDATKLVEEILEVLEFNPYVGESGSDEKG